jgi:methionyl-tRNA formyltransferase
MGSPDFALPTLAALTDAYHVVGVVTQPDRPAGRGRKMQPPEVKVLAQSLGLPVLQPISMKDPEIVENLRSLSPDVIVVAAFGQILKADVLTMPPFGCVNVHASLLPRWRGAAPVQAALLFDQITGVTFMKMDQGLDTGLILSQHSLPIEQEMTAGELSDELAQLGAQLLIETLPLYFYGEINPQPQNEAEATYAPRLKKADGELDFMQPAEFLTRQIRAFHPWPGSFAYFDGNPIKVYQAHMLEKADAVPGKRYIIDSKPAWGTQAGLLVLDEVQAAGKGRLAGEDFLRGTRDWLKDQED